MKKTFLTAILVIFVTTAGCDYQSYLEKSDKAGQALQTYAETGKAIPSAITAAEMPVSALEDAAGQTIDTKLSDKIEAISSRVEAIAGIVQKGAAIGAAAPGPQQGIATGVLAIAGLLGTISASVTAFAKNRKKKAAELALKRDRTALDTIVKGIDTMDGKEQQAVLESITENRKASDTNDVRAAVADAKARVL